MKSNIVFSFDTEDFTTERCADSVLAMASLLTEEGVVGHFNIVGLFAQKLLEWGRQDVIDALRPHLIGTHSHRHSVHPTLAEVADDADFARSYAAISESEAEGLSLIRKAFGDHKILFSAPPGANVCAEAMYYYSSQDISIYCGGLIQTDDADLIDYASITQIPYFPKELEAVFMPDSPQAMSMNDYLDEVSMYRYVCFCHHPNMAVKSVFWDELNYKEKNLRPYNDWIVPEDRPLGQMITFWSNVRKLIRRLKTDDRFCVTDLQTVINRRECHRPAPITREKIAGIVGELSVKFGPTKKGPYCISDIFYGLASLLNGKESYTPGLVRGFLEKPYGISSEVSLSRSGVLEAASAVRAGDFIPSHFTVDGVEIGPADFLFAMAAAFMNEPEECILLSPRNQNGDISELSFLNVLKLKNTWLFSNDFNDTYVSDRIRLQNWTYRKYDC